VYLNDNTYNQLIIETKSVEDNLWSGQKFITYKMNISLCQTKYLEPSVKKR